MTLKNLYGAKVEIYFGDFNPDASFVQRADGTVVVTEMNDTLVCTEDFGKFSLDGFQKILTELAQFKKEYTWVPLIYKWLPNKMVDEFEQVMYK